MNHWSVIRTRARWEKKVVVLLQQKGIEAFCPLLKARHQWSDRMKTVEKPLLKSVVFVKVGNDHRTVVRLTEGVMNFVHCNGKPVLVKGKTIQSIRRFQQAHSSVEVVEAGRLNEDNHFGKTKQTVLRLDALNLVLVAHAPRPAFVEAIGR